MAVERNHIRSYQNQFASHIRDPILLNNMITRSMDSSSCNVSLSCILNNTACDTTSDQPITCLYDPLAQGTVIFREDIPTNGFDVSGNPCNSFDSKKPDGVCVVRPFIFWKPLCPPNGPCIHPEMEFFISARVASRTKIAVNPAKWSLRQVVQ
jgi:hypothetical protein